LNRRLEETTAVGNEFASIEALWSQFENVMGREKEAEVAAGLGDKQGGEGEGDG